MSVAECITEALNVWKENGLYDAPDLRVHVEKLESIRKQAGKSPASTRQAAHNAFVKANKKQFQLTIGRAKSAEKQENILNRLLPLAKDDAELAAQSLNDLLDFGTANPKQKRPDGMQSMVGRRKALQMEMDAKLRDIKNRYYNTSYFRLSAKAEADDVRLEMEGGDSGNPQAKEDADYIKSVFLEYRDMLRATGTWADELDKWSPNRVQRGRVMADPDGFKDYLRAKLAEKQHPDTEDSIEYIYDSIIDPTPPEEKVLSMSREVFLKTPEDHVEYAKRFGQPDFIEALDGYTRQLASAIAEAEVFGPDGARTAKNVIETTVSEVVKNNPRSTLTPRPIYERFEVATDRVMDVDNVKPASFFASARNFASSMFLGTVPLSIVTQDAAIAPLQNARKFGWGQAFADNMKSYVAMFDPETRKYLQEYLGIMEHQTHLLSPDARFAMDSPITGVENFSRKAAIFTMRASGSEALDQIVRGTQALNILRGVGRSLNDDWEDLPQSVRQLMENNALGKGSWNKLRTLQNEILDPDSKIVRIDSIQDPELRRQMRSFLVREVESAALRPDTTTRALLLGGRRGTVGGEVTKFVSQFLAWPIDFARKVLAAQVRQGVPGAMAAGTALFAMSVVTEQMYATLRGQPGYAMDNPNLYWRAMARSGILTPAGELIIGSAIGDWRASPSLGPALDTAAQLFGRTGKIGQAAFEGDADAVIAEAVRTTRTVIPNLWWLEGAIIEPAFQAIMWEIDPDYMRRREQNWERERG